MMNKVVAIIIALIVLVFGVSLVAQAPGFIDIDELSDFAFWAKKEIKNFDEEAILLMELYFDSFNERTKACQELEYDFTCACEAVEPPAHRGAQVLYYYNETDNLTYAYLFPVTVDLSAVKLSEIPNEDKFSTFSFKGKFGTGILKYSRDNWWPVVDKYFLMLEHSLRPYNGDGRDLKGTKNDIRGWPYNQKINAITLKTTYKYAEPVGPVAEWQKEIMVLPHTSENWEDIYSDSKSLDYWEPFNKETMWILNVIDPDTSEHYITFADSSEYIKRPNIYPTRDFNPQIDRMPNCFDFVKDASELEKIEHAFNSATRGTKINDLNLRYIPKDAYINFINQEESSGRKYVRISGINFPEHQEAGVWQSDKLSFEIDGAQAKLRMDPEEEFGQTCQEHIDENGIDSYVECFDTECEVCVFTGRSDSPPYKVTFFEIRQKDDEFIAGFHDFEVKGKDVQIVDDSEYDTNNEYVIVELI